MPIPTPFHTKTAPLCESHEWRTWSGYLSAGLYEPSFEREYFAIRNSAALIDVSPLFKYEISGPDAAKVVNRLITRDINKCRVGQAYYSPWCDEDGKVIDDGVIVRLDQNHFRISAADPNLNWFRDVAYGFQAQVRDVSTELATLSLQGPNSRAILRHLLQDVDIDQLKYFRSAVGRISDFPLTITRTGYTGDLGYELWVRPQHAERLWDCLIEAGAPYGALPAGMIALDITRIEAGMMMIEVDYISSHHARIEAQKSSPFELGLGWAVALDKDPFIGQKALAAEKKQGSPWTFIGVAIDWPDLERLFDLVNLPPQVTGRASREPVPLYKNGRQVGQITSRTFSPILKKYIGLGTILSDHAAVGTPVEIEITVEYSRERGKATIVNTPFYNPKQKRS